MLSAYHQRYAERSDADITRRALVKETGLREVMAKTGFHTSASPLRVAILGCAERRFVGHHRDIFTRLLGLPADVTTFDISIEHLQGELGVVEHDIAKPLPGGPFDVAYGDVVLKFLPEEDRLTALTNAYDALRAPGIAVFMLDDADGLATEAWQGALDARGIRWTSVPVAIEGLLPETIHETAFVIFK